MPHLKHHPKKSHECENSYFAGDSLAYGSQKQCHDLALLVTWFWRGSLEVFRGCLPVAPEKLVGLWVIWVIWGLMVWRLVAAPLSGAKAWVHFPKTAPPPPQNHPCCDPILRDLGDQFAAKKRFAHLMDDCSICAHMKILSSTKSGPPYGVRRLKRSSLFTALLGQVYLYLDQ